MNSKTLNVPLLTACKDELPNPYRNCIREHIEALVCHEHDHRRMSIELRNLQRQHKSEIEKIEFRSPASHQLPTCADESDRLAKISTFVEHMGALDAVNECFTHKIEQLKKDRDEVLENAKKCFLELSKEKCKFKEFHERTIDYLKKYAIKSNDAVTIRNCERDMCEMQRLFVKEVTFLKKSEAQLQPFLKQLEVPDFQYFCNCCCFRDYEWAPPGKSFAAAEETANVIKEQMSGSLVKALAQAHIQQPMDLRSFLANQLGQMEKNQKMVEEKLKLFGEIS